MSLQSMVLTTARFCHVLCIIRAWYTVLVYYSFTLSAREDCGLLTMHRQDRGNQESYKETALPNRSSNREQETLQFLKKKLYTNSENVMNNN